MLCVGQFFNTKADRQLQIPIQYPLRHYRQRQLVNEKSKYTIPMKLQSLQDRREILPALSSWQ